MRWTRRRTAAAVSWPASARRCRASWTCAWKSSRQYFRSKASRDSVAKRRREGHGEQVDGRRQRLVRRQAQLAAVSDGEQGIPAEDIALAMRHLQPKAGQAAVALDDAAEDARRDQQRGRVGAAQDLLKVVGRQAGGCERT